MSCTTHLSVIYRDKIKHGQAKTPLNFIVLITCEMIIDLVVGSVLFLSIYPMSHKSLHIDLLAGNQYVLTWFGSAQLTDGYQICAGLLKFLVEGEVVD